MGGIYNRVVNITNMDIDEKALIFNKGVEVGKEHSTPSPETKKLIKNLMDSQDLIIRTIEEMKRDLCERIEKSDQTNLIQHQEIIKRQDHTNGSIAEANLVIAKVKLSQIILRVILTTIFVLLAILGFMPERLYEMFKGIF